MTRACRIVQAYGWSFFKAGFRGPKQLAWLVQRSFFKDYEVDASSLVAETPPPAEDSLLSVPMKPLPSDLVLDPFQVEELSLLYNSWNRFRIAAKIDDLRPKFDLERELRRSRVDLAHVRSDFRNRARKAAKLGFSSISRFPVFVGQLQFSSQRSLKRFFLGRLLTPVSRDVLLPAELVNWYEDHRRSPFGRLSNSDESPHWAVLYRLSKVLEFSKAPRLQFSKMTKERT
jgi:hypothetical protein